MLVSVTYLINHGGSKKDDVKKMHESTALALKAHKVVVLTEDVKSKAGNKPKKIQKSK